MAGFAEAITSLERQLAQLRQLSEQPALAGLRVVAQPAPVPAAIPAPATAQPSSLTNQQEMLLAMYDEFAVTDDGKALAAGLSKFARFVQSKTAKAAQ